MFDKIKDKLKNVFKDSENIIEENPDKITEIPVQEFEKKSEEETLPNSEEKEQQKSFFSKIFKKKEEQEENEIEELQKDMLEEVPEEEKKAIKEHKKLENAQHNLEELENNIEKEEQIEKKELEDVEQKPEGFLSKTFAKLKSKNITDEDFERIWVNLEIFLLEINIAYEIVQKIEKKLKEVLIGNSFDRFKLSGKIREVLEEEVEEVLSAREGNFLEELQKIKESEGIVKILVLGVNGTGKTTTIAKIVNLLQKNNLSVVVAASDTFRAAAIEQLEEHSKKLKFKLIQHKGGSDPAAVAYDSIEHARAKKLDVVLIDTAGRMPNNSNLMMELQKVKKISQAQMAIFVGDSISGNDLTEQIELFDKGIQIDGIILTKVDTDERPGSVVTAAYTIKKPIYFLGVGQDYDDLIKFDAKLIAEKLFEVEE